MLYAPAGAPGDVVQRVNRDVDRVLKEPDCENFRLRPVVEGVGTPDSLRQFHKEEHERWARLVKATGIQPSKRIYDQLQSQNMAELPDPNNLFQRVRQDRARDRSDRRVRPRCCISLARAGARTVLTASSAPALDKLAAEVKAAGGDARTIARRAQTEADAQAMVDAAVKAFGGLDIVVTASGMNDPAPIVEQSLERWEAIMDANVRGSWLVCKAAGAQMIKQGRGGKVVLMSYARSVRGHPAGYSGYCTSKSAIDGLARTLGCEWGKYKINVNAIGPTVFRSNLTAWMFAEDEKGEGRAARDSSRLPSDGWARPRPGRRAVVPVLRGLRFLHWSGGVRRRRAAG
jgi:NAD(P)-dependent dehydrogenase (short-subunit alcohol dehydrogenase family)